MSKRVIRGDLSEKGIQSIIDQLRAYKQELPKKAELLCRKLAEAGLVVAESSIAESPLGKTISVRIDMEPSKAGCKARKSPMITEPFLLYFSLSSVQAFTTTQKKIPKLVRWATESAPSRDRFMLLRMGGITGVRMKSGTIHTAQRPPCQCTTHLWLSVKK